MAIKLNLLNEEHFDLALRAWKHSKQQHLGIDEKELEEHQSLLHVFFISITM